MLMVPTMTIAVVINCIIVTVTVHVQYRLVRVGEDLPADGETSARMPGLMVRAAEC